MFRKSQCRQAAAKSPGENFYELLRTSGAGFPGKHRLPAPQHEGKVNKSWQTPSRARQSSGAASPPPRAQTPFHRMQNPSWHGKNGNSARESPKGLVSDFPSSFPRQLFFRPDYEANLETNTSSHAKKTPGFSIKSGQIWSVLVLGRAGSSYKALG